MSNFKIQSWKYCALPVITTMALWQTHALRDMMYSDILLVPMHIVFMIVYLLRSSCFCEIWALCVSWISYDHLYYAPYIACWALFGSMVPAMCNRTCAQVHELPQSHCGEKREGTLFSWLHICYAHLASVRFEHSVCRGPKKSAQYKER